MAIAVPQPEGKREGKCVQHSRDLNFRFVPLEWVVRQLDSFSLASSICMQLSPAAAAAAALDSAGAGAAAAVAAAAAAEAKGAN